LVGVGIVIGVVMEDIAAEMEFGGKQMEGEKGIHAQLSFRGW
jgi:hypothetical protein